MIPLLLMVSFLVDTAQGFERCALALALDADDVRTVQVEIADSPDARAIGLMGRQAVPAGTGMLFDFGSEQPVTMWMKNTLVSLDMAFFTDDGALVHVARGTEPLSLRLIPAPQPVRYVLELHAGEGEPLVPGRGHHLDLESLAACTPRPAGANPRRSRPGGESGR